jgi:hypothetical protein
MVKMIKDARGLALLMKITAILLTSGCVGVIEQLAAPITKGASTELPRINFYGVHDVIAIANDKVEVYFFPAVGEVRDLTYIISYDGAPNPISVPAENLRADYRGLYRYTIRDLEINRVYNFSVQVERVNGQRSDSTRSINVRTFSNLTANFFGIGSVRNTAGTDGLTSLAVSWPEAERRGTIFVPNELDTIEYEIVVVDSEFLTPGDFNNREFDRPLRYVFRVPGVESSRVINGLSPGREYHVQVRAIHQGFLDFETLSGYKREENNSYITISTLSTDSSGIEFDPSNITARRFDGALGLTSIQVDWDQAVGAFNHFRIYFNPTSTTFTAVGAIGVNCLASSVIPCKKVRFDRYSTIVTDLLSLREYEINVAICIDIDCSNYNLFERKTAVTDPGIAIYGGISNILNPRNVTRLNEIYLQTEPPDVTSGNIDGLLVEVKARADVNGPSTDVILNHPTIPNTSNLSLGDFDFETVTEFVVSGIVTGSPDPYCFSAFPYVYEDSILVEKRENEIIRCHNPQLEVPTIEQFAGLQDILTDNFTNTVDLFWESPSGGLASQIRVFVRSDGGQFNFSQAVSMNAAYTMFTVGISETQLTIPFLPPGNYSFGVLTYTNALASPDEPGDGYSEFNLSILEADF